VENQDLWKRLIELAGKHRIHWNLIRGHADNEENNLCDRLATGEIKKHREKRAQPPDLPSLILESAEQNPAHAGGCLSAILEP
jgi:hypothetical protein